MKELPEQLAQSGWQARQEPEEENVLEGQLETHLPAAASWLDAHVRQNVADPAQVLHEKSQGVQVRLSWGETNVPDGQLSTHLPFDSTKPGRQPVHCAKLTVEAPLKFGILQEVHLESQASHSFLLLSAMRLEPSQMPSEFAATHAPLNKNRPEAQIIQSLEVPPVQVSQDGEHGVHAVPLLKLPSGHTVPVEVVDWGGMHLVRSLGFCVNPDLQAVHTPVPSAHCEQPSWQTLQSPVEVRKNPGEHFAHAVPLSAAVKPALQAHCPLAPQTPLRQLHVDDALETLGFRHLPVPVIPSSHELQPAGQGLH